MKERQSRTDLEPVRWIGSPEVYGASFFVLRSSFLFRRRRSDDQLERDHSAYHAPEDWVFANPRMKGRHPYWGQEIMRRVIRPIALQLGITKHIGWHTFRHTYSTLLRANRADIKVMQELLRHASSRVTMDTYTQAVTAQKRKAQSGVIRLIRVRAIVPATGV